MPVINWVILILTALTATGLLFSRDWRWSLGMLAFQYLGVFWMIQTLWPISMAAAKLITGWMCCAVLGIAQLSVKREGETEFVWLQGRLFQIFAAGLVFTVAVAISSRVVEWLGVDQIAALGSLFLIGLGLLHLGITSDPFQVIIGLLTVLAGFEILYASVETSTLVTALLAVVNLGLALAGAYSLISPQERTS